MRETLHRIPASRTMHGRRPAKLPVVCPDPPARDVSLTAASGPLPYCGSSLGHFGCGPDHTPCEPLSSLVDEGRDIAQLAGTNASH